jgi:hypothetical protein
VSREENARVRVQPENRVPTAKRGMVFARDFPSGYIFRFDIFLKSATFRPDFFHFCNGLSLDIVHNPHISSPDDQSHDDSKHKVIRIFSANPTTDFASCA